MIKLYHLGLIYVIKKWEPGTHFHEQKHRLLTTIKNTRLAIITEQKQVEWMETFFKLDKEQVVLLGSEDFEFSLSI